MAGISQGVRRQWGKMTAHELMDDLRQRRTLVKLSNWARRAAFLTIFRDYSI